MVWVRVWAWILAYRLFIMKDIGSHLVARGQLEIGFNIVVEIVVAMCDEA